MATVNIPSYHDDPNYRYKMPRVKAKVEGRGNGVKTNIMNMADIARALKRAPEYATKFCGCELGASSKFEAAEGKAIVNGIHPEGEVQIVIDKFIERFVLCPKCKLPEIDLGVVQGRVLGSCNACGFSGDMDNAHKVATFIVKNPPANNDSTMGKKKDAHKRSSKDGAAAGGSSSKDKKDKKDRKKKHHHRHERQLLSYSSEEILNVVERLVNFLKKGEKPSAKDFFQEVRLLQVAQDFGGALRVYCALCALHRWASGKLETPLTPQLLQQYMPYLSAVCDRSIEHGMVLEALEQFVQRHQDSWSSFAVLLSTLYQADIVEEENVLSRYSTEPKQQQQSSPLPEQNTDAPESVKAVDSAVDDDAAKDADIAFTARLNAFKNAQAFVNWLKEAESASSSSDEEDTTKPTVAAAAPPPPPADSSNNDPSDQSDSDDQY